MHALHEGGRCRHENLRHPAGLWWACLKNEPLSKFIPYSGLILVVFVALFALAKQYIFEQNLMQLQGRYREAYNNLKARDQRTLINHHVSFCVKILILCLGIFPFMRIALGADFSTPIHASSRITLGDVMLIVSDMYTSMYIFELCYRTGISPIAWMHHMGTASMAQVAICLTHRGNADGSIELMLCWIWGLFDIVSEAIPHLTLILYRLYPTRHAYLHAWFSAATYASLFSTVVETGIILWIYTALFHRWSLALKIVTPLCHALFTVAQFWSAHCLWALTKREKKRMGLHGDAEVAGGGGERASEGSRRSVETRVSEGATK